MRTMPVYFVIFPTQHVLASTMMRFEEFYESEYFKGKIFTREEFEDWYAQKHGEFTYYKDWTAFNIPNSVIQIFRKGKFNPLTEKEKQLIRLLRDIEKEAIIVGISRQDRNNLPVRKHEFLHACFALMPAYRKNVEKIVIKYDVRKLKNVLTKNGGYHPHVFIDEIHAYVLANIFEFKHELKGETYPQLRKELDINFTKHFNFSLVKARMNTIMSRVRVTKFPVEKVGRGIAQSG